jgi:hypothetical protein
MDFSSSSFCIKKIHLGLRFTVCLVFNGKTIPPACKELPNAALASKQWMRVHNAYSIGPNSAADLYTDARTTKYNINKGFYI